MSTLQLGTRAPDFSIVDEAGGTCALADFRGRPVVVALLPAARRNGQPALQHLTFDGERLPVLAPADEHVASLYGAGNHPAVFVVDGRGLIAWRHAGDGAPPVPTPGLSRRDFLAAMLAASLAATFTSGSAAAAGLAAERTPAAEVELAFTVNGRPVRLSLDPRVTLLDTLREHLRLTGTKKGCDHGQCGACTVHVAGRRVLSCLTLAAAVHGKSVTTIEGLARGAELHPIQQAFIDNDGFQCGYCTSGQIMSAVALLDEPCGPADDDVRECMSGNICRCGAYPGIVAAVQSVRRNR